MLPKGTFPLGGNRKFHRQRLLAKQRAMLQLVKTKAAEASITVDESETVEDCIEAIQATLHFAKAACIIEQRWRVVDKGQTRIMREMIRRVVRRVRRRQTKNEQLNDEEEEEEDEEEARRALTLMLEEFGDGMFIDKEDN